MSEKQQTRWGRRRATLRGSQRTKTRTLLMVGGVFGLGLVLLLAVLGLFGKADESTQPSADVSTGSSTGSSIATKPNAAADVVMKDFDGNTVTISDLEGQPAVVNFWATSCPACFAEMPAFEKVYQANRGSVQFLGINLSEDIETALRVVEETGVSYPLARDPQGEVFAAFGGFGMPTTVFLDENGGVIEMYTGELTAKELEERIVEYFQS